MSDLAFYNAGCQEPKGARRIVVPFRRGLRRVLRPIFLRQVEILQSLCDRLDAAERSDRVVRHDLDSLSQRQNDLGDQLQTTIAFGWDYTALVRRLIALEDRVETLSAERDTRYWGADDRQLALPFPESEDSRRSKAG